MRPHAACAKCLPPEHYLQAAEAAASHGTPTQAAYATYGETRSYPSQVSPAHLLTYAGPHLTPQSPLGTPLDLASISPQSPLGSLLDLASISLRSPFDLPPISPPSALRSPLDLASISLQSPVGSPLDLASISPQPPRGSPLDLASISP